MEEEKKEEQVPPFLDQERGFMLALIVALVVVLTLAFCSKKEIPKKQQPEQVIIKNYITVPTIEKKVFKNVSSDD